MSDSSLHLNLLIAGAGHHPAAWRLGTRAYDPVSLSYYADLARTAEQGKFDAITLLDDRGMDDGVAATPHRLRLEPLTVLGALAALTQRIGLIAEVPTQHNQPYNTARRLASLDHASNGRAGWLAADEEAPDVAARFDQDGDPQAWARSAEYATVLRRLWDSWGDGARIADKAAGNYVRTDLIQPIDHEGRAFRVAGPIDIPRPPQGHVPVMRQGDPEGPGADDCEVFINRPADLEQARRQRRHLQGLRNRPQAWPVVSVVCSPSDSQRARLLDALAAHASPHWPPAWPVIAGHPAQVADALLHWRDSGAADGFSLALPVTADGLEDVVQYLVPELQHRGALRRDYGGGTLRAHAGLPRPAGRAAATPAA
ncbi:LLM class flavin-dependent oxidoreductase [Bordetella genomosp. 13]|uniref:LLM class flavin-dependent oxidoreductase n=1 Tax=Bordetella genomosp. 13 TaxID=463040 RepID=UPI00164331AD|nr:LLM class flavin-dependent oxidoreductase [Bordetella genomosp. 13]